MNNEVRLIEIEVLSESINNVGNSLARYMTRNGISIKDSANSLVVLYKKIALLADWNKLEAMSDSELDGLRAHLRYLKEYIAVLPNATKKAA
ncbi:MAG: hypothetical protein LBN08_03415 [Lactobacillales bacterium]|jgi:hypothetical protein|nr:hypothetical protein [Lactobacillales bacterium]